jgi:hypothetical protein
MSRFTSSSRIAGSYMMPLHASNSSFWKSYSSTSNYYYGSFYFISFLGDESPPPIALLSLLISFYSNIFFLLNPIG